MNFLNNKRSEIISLILIVIVIIAGIGWLINIGTRECRSNSQCSADYYCGSDFSCHQIPTIEKTIVKNNLILPSFIIGIAIILAAIILRFRKKSSYTESFCIFILRVIFRSKIFINKLIFKVYGNLKYITEKLKY